MKQRLLSIARIKVPDLSGIIMIYLAVFTSICAGVMFYCSVTSPEAKLIERQQQQYFEQLQKENEGSAAERAWKRLHRKHGQPGAVIYEPGKTPWYTDRQGRKCKFI